MDDERQPWRRVSPEVDRLQDAADAAETAFGEVMVVASAESTVSSARVDDLHREQLAAWRRHSAAKGWLTRAQRDGDAERIAWARARVEERFEEAVRISDAGIAEMRELALGSVDRLDRVMVQADAADAARREVRDALEGPGGE